MRDQPAGEGHPLAFGHPINALQACPDCPIGHANEWCPTCHGEELITVEQLAQWQARQTAILRGEKA